MRLALAWFALWFAFLSPLRAQQPAELAMVGVGGPGGIAILCDFTVPIAGSTGGTTSGTGASACSATGATFIWVGVIVETSSGSQTCGLTADSSSNSYTPLNFTSLGNAAGLRHYYKFNPSVSGAMTWTVSGTNCFSTVNVIVAKRTLNVLDKQSGANQLYTGASVTTLPVCGTISCAGGSSMTPAQPGELAIAVMGFNANYGASGCTINQGFTAPTFTPFSTGNNYGSCMSYLIQGTAASLGPNFTWGTAGSSIPSALVFFE